MSGIIRDELIDIEAAAAIVGCTPRGFKLFIGTSALAWESVDGDDGRYRLYVSRREVEGRREALRAMLADSIRRYNIKGDLWARESAKEGGA